MKLKAILLASAAFALAACESNDRENPVVPEPTPTFNLQVIHASADAPPVNIIVDGAEAAGGIDFKDTVGPLDIAAGTYNIEVEAILPDGNGPAIGPVDLPFTGDTITTVVAANSVTAGLDPLIISQPRTPVSPGSARAFVLHGAASAPTVDVFVTAPGADLTGEAPLGTFSYTETLGPVEVPAGDYQIRVTAAGDSSAVVYDSGTVGLSDGLDIVLVAAPNVEGGSAAITLIGQTPDGGLELRDTNAPASLRVVHASPDAPAVDVVVNATLPPLVEDLAFPTATPIVEVPPATYQTEVAAADAYPNAVVIPNDGSTIPLALAAGTTTNVLAIGNLADITAIVADGDPRSVGLYAKVRIIHASPTAADVDIYVAAPGTDITTIAPTLTAVPFGANTGFLALPAAETTGTTYEVTVTPTGTTTAAIGPAPLPVVRGGVYTAIARDATGGGAPLGLILLDDTPTP